MIKLKPLQIISLNIPNKCNAHCSLVFWKTPILVNGVKGISSHTSKDVRLDALQQNINTDNSAWLIIIQVTLHTRFSIKKFTNTNEHPKFDVAYQCSVRPP